MTRTTQCPQCQIPLNVPVSAGQKRLKCPKCGTRFYPDGRGPSSASASQTPPSSGGTTPATRRPASSVFADPANLSNVGLPTNLPSMRDLADIPLADDNAPPPPPPLPPPVGNMADARLFFEDSEETPAPKPAGASARMRPRPCPVCRHMVPAGMSICAECDTDVETGQRVTIAVEEVVEELDEAPPEADDQPIAIYIVGSLTLVASVVLGVLTLVNLEGVGAISLFIICLFGMFASIQFLQGRSVKLLMITLAFAAAVDVIGLVVMPIWQMNESPQLPGAAVAAGEEPGAADAFDDDMPRVVPLQKQLRDSGAMNKISAGIAILALDAALFVFLCSTGVRDRFERRPANGFVPGGPF